MRQSRPVVVQQSATVDGISIVDGINDEKSTTGKLQLYWLSHAPALWLSSAMRASTSKLAVPSAHSNQILGCSSNTRKISISKPSECLHKLMNNQSARALEFGWGLGACPRQTSGHLDLHMQAKLAD